MVGIAGGAVLLVHSAELLFVIDRLTPQQYGLVGLHSVLMFSVCSLACVVPTRRALAVEPVEALSVEG